jgi:hypothetical protein
MPVVKQSWKVLAGALLGLAGAVAIITAWFRVRDLLEVADQVPILVSGGMGGLALIMGGVWLLRSHESDLLFRHLQETTERLERVEEDVARLAQLFDGARVEIDMPEIEVPA